MVRRARLGAAIAGGVAMALIVAAPALADTSQSTASALQITPVGGGLASTGQTTASNDGTTETLTGTELPALAVLGAQTVITAGVLAQVSRAFNDGTSAACAGVLGTGGVVTVGANGVCAVTPSAQVVLTLGVIGLTTISLQADAITSSCTADSTPAASGAASLINASIVATTAGIPVTLVGLPANPPPNTALNVPGLFNLQLNAQSSSGPGHIGVNALELSVLIDVLASVTIGAVTCGANAVAPPIPAIPLAGAPIAGGLLAVGALAGVVWFRRRRAAMAGAVAAA